MKLGFIGLGKMGSSMIVKLLQEQHELVVWNRSEEPVEEFKSQNSRLATKRAKFKIATQNLKVANTIRDLVLRLEKPRVVWIMVTAGEATQGVLDEISKYVEKDDVVIDGGNSYYKDSMRRAKKFEKQGVYFLDVGVSGGPVSIKLGKFAIMVGGEKQTYEKCKPIFRDLSYMPSGYMGSSGAGNFAKMIHNGIEFGMMQALDEGFTILKKAPFKFDLEEVAKVYNSNSIITSRLVGWIQEGFGKYGEELDEASGAVAHTGEGEWTLKTAKELKVSAPVIESAFKFRIESKKSPSYTGKILSMLRAVFGGHPI